MQEYKLRATGNDDAVLKVLISSNRKGGALVAIFGNVVAVLQDQAAPRKFSNGVVQESDSDSTCSSRSFEQAVEN